MRLLYLAAATCKTHHRLAHTHDRMNWMAEGWGSMTRSEPLGCLWSGFEPGSSTALTRAILPTFLIWHELEKNSFSFYSIYFDLTQSTQILRKIFSYYFNVAFASHYSLLYYWFWFQLEKKFLGNFPNYMYNFNRKFVLFAFWVWRLKWKLSFWCLII